MLQTMVFTGQFLSEVYADTVVGIMVIATSGLVPNVYAKEVKDRISSHIQVTIEGILTK
jgi:hypothetical protein